MHLCIITSVHWNCQPFVITDLQVDRHNKLKCFWITLLWNTFTCSISGRGMIFSGNSKNWKIKLPFRNGADSRLWWLTTSGILWSVVIAWFNFSHCLDIQTALVLSFYAEEVIVEHLSGSYRSFQSESDPLFSCFFLLTELEIVTNASSLICFLLDSKTQDILQACLQK